MGIIKTLFIFIFPIGGYASYLAFKLGKDLPMACRMLGRNIGMGYNYFKVVIKLFAPTNDTPAEIIDTLRKSNQQTIAFSRELRETIMRAKQDIKDALPADLKMNPFQKILGVKPDQPIQNPDGQLNGTTLINLVYKERRRLIDKKKSKNETKGFNNM